MARTTRHTHRRTARRLGRTVLFGAVRGAAAATGSALVTCGLLWWGSR
ncbi:hypothetical protein [Streptomyces yaizuensis]|uniref:Uncharacterized protein n=1 Tax=Streptomyces yaizuensis TaxID=2989713 RepID=A0ABQ5P0Y8_9ACTN|nr:hypothetical protein [Streptomyces sp. YSPA8]GLF95886.1 hypothetical protein SYYSPA8_16335 [Streptomyces sp. YSPA8]